MAAPKILNGTPGTAWTNDTGKVRWQFVVNWVNSCGRCIQHDHAISTSRWPIPLHRNCRCRIIAIYPGQTARPFIDFREEIDKLPAFRREHVIGKAALKLVEKHVLRWPDVVLQGRIRPLSEIVARHRLTVERMVEAGVDRRTAQQAYDRAHGHEPEALAEQHRAAEEAVVAAKAEQMRAAAEATRKRLAEAEALLAAQRAKAAPAPSAEAGSAKVLANYLRKGKVKLSTIEDVVGKRFGKINAAAETRRIEAEEATRKAAAKAKADAKAAAEKARLAAEAKAKAKATPQPAAPDLTPHGLLNRYLDKAVESSQGSREAILGSHMILTGKLKEQGLSDEEFARLHKLGFIDPIPASAYYSREDIETSGFLRPTLARMIHMGGEPIYGVRLTHKGLLAHQQAAQAQPQPQPQPQTKAEAVWKPRPQGEFEELRSPAKIEDWGKRVFEGWADSLSNYERPALKQYAGQNYEWMNGLLRGSTEELHRLAPALSEAEAMKTVNHIDTALRKGKTDRDLTMFRGVKDVRAMKLDPATINVGDEITMQGFASASLKEDIAIDFATKNDVTRHTYILKINVPAGSTGGYLNAGEFSGYAHEREFLMPHGTKYRFVKHGGEVADRWGTKLRVLVLERIE